MRYLVGQILIGGKIVWQDTSGMGGSSKPPGLQITFPLSGYISDYEFSEILKEDLPKNNIEWLWHEAGAWKLNSDLFKNSYDNYASEEWLNGTIEPAISIEHKREKIFDRENDKTYYKFIITPDMIQQQMPKKIFLSHKGINKPLVRQFSNALQILGLSPWLDEDAMNAGTDLERGLLSGFEDSCAAVFFITPDFKDESYLASEVNYAISQKRKKANKFSIITLVFSDAAGKKGTVPDLLRQYVWKEPESDLSALVEIVKALPVKIGEIGWQRP